MSRDERDGMERLCWAIYKVLLCQNEEEKWTDASGQSTKRAKYIYYGFAIYRDKIDEKSLSDKASPDMKKEKIDKEMIDKINNALRFMGKYEIIKRIDYPNGLISETNWKVYGIYRLMKNTKNEYFNCKKEFLDGLYRHYYENDPDGRSDDSPKNRIYFYD